MTPLLKVEGLGHSYGARVGCTDVGFDLYPGEVMGIGDTFGEAFAKAQQGASMTLPEGGTAFISVRERDKADAVVLSRRLHQLGFTQEQAQEVYNLAAEKMVPMIAELAAEFQADREVEKLINHFGGAENWKEISRQLLSFGRQNLPPELWGRAISLFTVVFAFAQTLGPYGAGLVGDLVGNIGISLLTAAGLLLVGAGIALTQRPLERG